MRVDEEMVHQLCRLARLDLTEGELGPMARALDRILDHMGQLARVQTGGAEGSAVFGALRPDLPSPSLPRAELLGLTPHTDGRYFLVPTAVEGET